MQALPNHPGIPPLIALVRAMRDCCKRQEGEMCQKLGLNGSQFACLLIMPENDELNVQQIAYDMELSPSRASRIIDTLVQAGLLERKARDHDRRQQHVLLTELGRQKLQEAYELLAECEQKFLSHLSVQKSRELQELMTAVLNAMAQEDRAQEAKILSALEVD
jgi:DNA-binding MarR family transcriptional regulator